MIDEKCHISKEYLLIMLHACLDPKVGQVPSQDHRNNRMYFSSIAAMIINACENDHEGGCR